MIKADWPVENPTEITLKSGHTLLLQAKVLQEQAARNTIKSALDPLLHVCDHSMQATARRILPPSCVVPPLMLWRNFIYPIDTLSMS